MQHRNESPAPVGRPAAGRMQQHRQGDYAAHDAAQAPLDQADVVVGWVQKNQRENVRIALTSFKGHQLVDARVYAARDDGEPGPTKAGLTVRLDRLPALIEALQQAEAEARRRGML